MARPMISLKILSVGFPVKKQGNSKAVESEALPVYLSKQADELLRSFLHESQRLFDVLYCGERNAHGLGDCAPGHSGLD